MFCGRLLSHFPVHFSRCLSFFFFNFSFKPPDHTFPRSKRDTTVSPIPFRVLPLLHRCLLTLSDLICDSAPPNHQSIIRSSILQSTMRQVLHSPDSNFKPFSLLHSLWFAVLFSCQRAPFTPQPIKFIICPLFPTSIFQTLREEENVRRS